ncbi:MAG TPA: competence/damage-inducible protein A, partial [Vicinamibacterales bacterium]
MAHVTQMHRAAIIAVGSEMLTPSKVDTNSLFITEQLNLIGIQVAFKSVVGDDRGDLEIAVREALARVDLLICCGGLGPTDDDLTRNVIADVLGRPLVEDESITARIRERFSRRNLEMPEINRRQAMVPAGGRVIPNADGTAPGLWIEDGDRLVLLLPGPPRELKPMISALAESALRDRVGGGMALVRRVIRITGRSESHVDEAMQPLYAEWSRAAVPIAATILASLGQIELHLTACCASRAEADHALRAAVEQVQQVMGLYVYSTDGRAMEEILGEMLVGRKLWIAVAESCTGGLIASRLTDVPGSSRYVERGVVSYSNAAKTELLGVSEEMIRMHGAVSEPVATAMAEGIRARARTDIGVGVTGVAGPDGGT